VCAPLAGKVPLYIPRRLWPICYNEISWPGTARTDLPERSPRQIAAGQRQQNVHQPRST